MTTTAHIDNLTPEQDAQLDTYYEKGLKIGLRCQPIDRAVAEFALNEVYRRADMPPPGRIIWCDNPIAASDFVGKHSPQHADPAYACYGTQDAGMISFYDCMRNLLGLRAETEEFCGLAWAAEAGVGWFWAFSKVCVASLPPLEIHVDADGSLHRLDGPALRYQGEGCDFYACHGTEVPAELILDHSKITVARIDAEQNVEVRRCLTEIYGEGRYLLDGGAKPIAEDKYGTLYRKEVPNDLPICMVRVHNTTPESDGSRRTFFLPVPAGCQTAHGAVAWGFEFDNPNDYAPDLES